MLNYQIVGICNQITCDYVRNWDRPVSDYMSIEIFRIYRCLYAGPAVSDKALSFAKRDS